MNHIIQVDESVERTLRDAAAKQDLMKDVVRGHKARAVIAEMNHAKQIRNLGEQTWSDSDFEMRLEGVFHGVGFHTLGNEYGYACWDDDEFVRDRLKRFPECKVRLRPRRTTLLMPGLHRS